MRREAEIMAQVLAVARSDDRIRAVLLTGSRADPNAETDIFKDFDIIYFVTQLEKFVNDKHWIDVFGERLILQTPDEMTTGNRDNLAFHYLMLFKDHNRIDLTLFPLEKLKAEFKRDGLTTVLLDKDNLFREVPPSNNADYLIKRPTEKEFADCCNEFWWVSTYVGKGLCREETTYAKHMMDVPVRSMFLKMVGWYIGVETNFTVSFGQAGRNIRQHVSPELYDKLLSTYPDSDTSNIWKALFLMAALFDELARYIAASLKFPYNEQEGINVIEHLEWSQQISKTK